MKEEKRIPLKEKICRELRQQIVFGSLMPNEHLKEARLAQYFGCTRGPVREALNQLEQQGFISLVPNQGATVREPSAQEVEDYYNLLALLEGKAVQWATPNLTDADIKQLETINNSLKQVIKTNETAAEDWIPLNMEFHRLFRQRCDNEKLNGIVEEIRTRISRYRYISLMVTAFADYAGDHEKIIELAAQNDAEKAGSIMEDHIRRAKQVLVQFLSRMPGRSL